MSDERECKDKFDRLERIRQLTAIEDECEPRRDEQERHFISASPPVETDSGHGFIGHEPPVKPKNPAQLE